MDLPENSSDSRLISRLYRTQESTTKKSKNAQPKWAKKSTKRRTALSPFPHKRKGHHNVALQSTAKRMQRNDPISKSLSDLHQEPLKQVNGISSSRTMKELPTLKHGDFKFVSTTLTQESKGDVKNQPNILNVSAKETSKRHSTFTESLQLDTRYKNEFMSGNFLYLKHGKGTQTAYNLETCEHFETDPNDYFTMSKVH